MAEYLPENGSKRIKIKEEPNTDSDGSEEENERDYTRLNKFYNESDDIFKDVDDIFDDVCRGLHDADNSSQKNCHRFHNIILVTDALHKDYVSHLKSESTNVNILECKNLSGLKVDSLNQECENSLWMIVTGLHSVTTVNNLSDLNSPYIPTIKKLSWNMKRLTDFEEEGRQLQKYLKSLLPESCAVVILPPLPAIIMVNAMNTTKSKKYAEFYSQFIKTTSQLTMEMLKEQDVQCGDSVKKYLEDEDSVYEMNSASVQDNGVLTVNKWKTLSDWYNILEEIAGLKIGSDFQMLGYKQSDVENENNINVHSAASFIRQANLVPSNNIPEIEKLEVSMIPCLGKWPSAPKIDIPPINGDSEYELKIFRNKSYKLQADKLKVESNVSRIVVVVGDKIVVKKFCETEIPTVKFLQLYVEDNDYDAAKVNIPDNFLRAENTVWIFFCDITSSMKKKRQSFCERNFSEKKCNVELNMNSLNCSTEKDRCKKLNEFLEKTFPSLGKNSIIIPSPIMPQISLLPASDTFKMEDFHNVVHETDDLRNLWIFLPSMQKLQIVDAIKKFDNEWWKNIEKIMTRQNLSMEFMLDYKENAPQSVEVLENPRLFKGRNKEYEDWRQFMNAIIVYYIHAIENGKIPLHSKKEPTKGVMMLGKKSSKSLKTHDGPQRSAFMAASIVKPPVLYHRPEHTSLQQGMHEDIEICKRKIYLYDIPKSLNNSALKNILSICGYITDFQREIVGGLRAASCMVQFRDIGSIYRAYHLLNGRKVLSKSLFVVIPEEKHFSAQEKTFDQTYEEDDSVQIKSIIADVSSWSSKSPELQKIGRPEFNKSLITSNYSNQRVSQASESRYLQSYSRDPKKSSARSRSRERSPSRDHKKHFERNKSREKSSSRDLKKLSDKIRSRKRHKSRDRRHSRDRSRSRSRSRSRDRRRSRDRSRSRIRSQEKEIHHEYKRSHRTRLSPKQNSSSGFAEASECIALITLSENLGVLAVSFKMLMESCVKTESINSLIEEDNMLLLNTIHNKFMNLQKSTSDVINAEKFKCGAKICKKLIDTVLTKIASKQIELPPTIPLQLSSPKEQQSVNLLKFSSTFHESTNQSVSSSDKLQQTSLISHLPTTSKSVKEPSAAEGIQKLHGVDIGRIAKSTMGKDAAAIKNFIENTLDYLGVTPTTNVVKEIYNAVSMIHFKWISF